MSESSGNVRSSNFSVSLIDREISTLAANSSSSGGSERASSGDNSLTDLSSSLVVNLLNSII